MRQVRDVLRLKWECELSDRRTARSCGISRPAVAEYVKRARSAGLSWPLPAGLDDAALEALLFPAVAALSRPRVLPDFAAVHRELARKGVTLALLWEEYKSAHPDGLQYSQFCERYRGYARRLDLTMRQVHRAGEKCFIDYAGQTVPVVDRRTGEVRQAQVFIAVLGASNYTYGEATWTQRLPDWIGSHVRAFDAFGAVPELLIPDNLRSAVTRAHRYEPLLNATYSECATHYGTAILPARVRRPRDKAKAEVGVQVVGRFVLARLRHQTFFSLEELNREIARLRQALNQRAFRKLPGNRQTLFETLDRPAMKPLPEARYVFAEWKRVRVHIELAHRGRRPLLLRALCAGAPRARCAPHRHDAGGVSPRKPGRLPRPWRHAWMPHHGPRTHAHRASGIRRVDADAPDCVGQPNGTGDRKADRTHHDEPLASATGLSLVPGDHAALEGLWA